MRRFVPLSVALSHFSSSGDLPLWGPHPSIVPRCDTCSGFALVL